MKTFLSTKEVGERLGINPFTLRLWVRKGLIGDVGRSLGGGRYLWSPKQVVELSRAIKGKPYVETDEEVGVAAQ